MVYIVSGIEKEEESKVRRSNETSHGMDDDKCSIMYNVTDDNNIAEEEETLKSLTETRLEMVEKPVARNLNQNV